MSLHRTNTQIEGELLAQRRNLFEVSAIIALLITAPLLLTLSKLRFWPIIKDNPPTFVMYKIQTTCIGYGCSGFPPALHKSFENPVAPKDYLLTPNILPSNVIHTSDMEINVPKLGIEAEFDDHATW